MEIRYVVDIDLSSAVDEHGFLDDYEASMIVSRSFGYPDGATVRLNIGDARGGALSRLVHMFSDAGTVEIVGSNTRGMKIVGEYLSGNDPFPVI